MTCSNCKCRECVKAALNAVLLRRVLARETVSPRDLPFVEQQNAAAIKLANEQCAWRDTFDPDAEQLAADVVREQVRVG